MKVRIIQRYVNILFKENKKGENGQTQFNYPVIIANDVTKGILPKIITFF